MRAFRGQALRALFGRLAQTATRRPVVNAATVVAGLCATASLVVALLPAPDHHPVADAGAPAGGAGATSGGGGATSGGGAVGAGPAIPEGAAEPSPGTPVGSSAGTPDGSSGDRAPGAAGP